MKLWHLTLTFNSLSRDHLLASVNRKKDVLAKIDLSTPSLGITPLFHEGEDVLPPFQLPLSGSLASS
jgi:hypothetical protein